MAGISIYQIIIVLVLLPIVFLPTIISLKKNHPYKAPIILINVLGGLLWGIGWLVALVWCFVIPESKKNAISSVADELDKLHSLKEKGVISEAQFETKKKELI